jgi:hypothetical protein
MAVTFKTFAIPTLESRPGHGCMLEALAASHTCKDPACVCVSVVSDISAPE